MPVTFVLTLIGGLSISAFPLFSGFVSKSMIVHAGLKVPYFIWFGKNNCKPETWEKAKDPVWNMTAAMCIAAFLCIFIGSYTPYLYSKLPFPVEYHPYNTGHVME